ncbi:hypothetical protein BH23ACT9_BH23ACT9_25600 [soil metagenome]
MRTSAPVEPYDSGKLTTGDGQHIYWETVGNPDGTPGLYLHGGPGSGCSSRARTVFNRSAYRAVLFDQRGCGRSRPSASDPSTPLHTNTTAHQIEDIERLRQHLHVERWVIYGVSWGVTLGLAYAQKYPARVAGMVLAAVTAGRRREIDWITRDMGRVFPREWERNDCFLTGGEEVLANMPALAAIPAVLIHGRHDVSSPLDTAWSLHRSWPSSELIVLDDAGHGGTGFTQAGVTALERLSRTLSARPQ